MNPDLKDRLFNKIGMGEHPKKRAALYRKLLRLEEQFGDIVTLDVAESWLFAKEEADQHEPGRLFCTTIIARLKDRGIWQEKSRIDGLSVKEALAKAFPDEEFPLTGEKARPRPRPLKDGEDPPDLREVLKHFVRQEPEGF